MGNKLKVGTWEQLKIHPTKLIRMVIDGKAKVIGKNKYGRYIYEVENIEGDK